MVEMRAESLVVWMVVRKADWRADSMVERMVETKVEWTVGM